jgi:gluconate 2-dehydrogenase gamma chain
VFIDKQLNGDFGRATSWYMKGPFDPAASADRGYQLSLTPAEVYRLGIRVVSRLCLDTYQITFTDLSVEQGEEFLEHVETGKIISPDIDLKTFLAFLIQNTKEGYFADPIHGGNKNMKSWTMIGYPGARGSFLEWVDKHNVPYPLGPVSIKGEQA